MIPGTNYAAFYDTDSLERISVFVECYGNPFIPCFAKEPKANENIAQSIQSTASSDIPYTKVL